MDYTKFSIFNVGMLKYFLNTLYKVSCFYSIWLEIFELIMVTNLNISKWEYS